MNFSKNSIFLLNIVYTVLNDIPQAPQNTYRSYLKKNTVIIVLPFEYVRKGYSLKHIAS